VTGLAGATTAIADSVEGVYNNAAAPAVREAVSLSWFEWEPSAGIALPGVYGGTDFNNRGEKGIDRNLRLGRRRTVETTDNFLYLEAGVWAQLGNLGLSATADFLRYDVSAPQQETPSLALSLTRVHLVGAYSFLGNQLCIGAGVRAVYVNISEVNNPNGAVIAMLGVAPQVGVIVKPDDVQWRIGATARAPVEAGPLSVGRVVEEQTSTGEVVRSAGSFVLPDRITQPWELEAGVAYQLGPRPLNPAWIDPHVHEKQLEERILKARAERQALHDAEIASLPIATAEDRAARELRISRIRAEEEEARDAEDIELRDGRQRLHEERKARYLNWPRERILLLGSVLLTGPSQNAVALEGFINRERELVGQNVSLSPRFAVESEPVPNFLRFRTGIYLEPSRFEDGTKRQHFTFGADVKLFPWDVLGLIPNQTWRLSAFLDVAPRYQNFGFAVGAWH
jgi:hypothetical protein